ncbi:MAG TPA: S1 RNA-binding domain-containing protein, partial [Candidatus Phocaeicola excrementigallinarum]|nr:S1 RNA-binding domain-containing protein [Candidatus Phocaeicola excrementigallinarum]
EGVIINKNPYSGIFVEVKGEGIGCIPRAALPKDYMQNKKMKKGMPIKVEVTSINELNQVKFKLVPVR